MKTMKPLQLMILLFALGLFTFSCKSDDDGGGGGDAGAGTITAKVDGTHYTTMEMVTFATSSGSSLIISGNTGTGTPTRAFTLNVMMADGVGTYPIGGGSNIFTTASYTEVTVDPSNPMNAETLTWQAPYSDAQAGEVKISELTSTHVKGTFHFKAKNVLGNNSIKNISEGSFNVAIQQN